MWKSPFDRFHLGLRAFFGRSTLVACGLLAVVLLVNSAALVQEQRSIPPQSTLSTVKVFRWPDASGRISPLDKRIIRQLQPVRNSSGEWEFWIVSDDLLKLNSPAGEGEGPYLVLAANENEKNSSTNIGAVSVKVLLSTFKETSTIDPTEATVEFVDHGRKLVHAVGPEIVSQKVAKNADEWTSAIWKYTHRRVNASDYVNGTFSQVNPDGSYSQSTISGSITREDKDAEAKNAETGKAWIADEVRKRNGWMEWILTKGFRAKIVTPDDSAGGWIFFPRSEKWKDKERMLVRIPTHVGAKTYIFEIPMVYLNDHLKTD